MVMKIKIIFDTKIQSSYEKTFNDTKDKVLQEYSLNAIKLRLDHTSKLSDDDLLKLCSIEEIKK